MKKISKKMLPKNTFVRAISVLIYGTASSQIIMIISTPFLTRIYSPSDYGIYSVFLGCLSLVGIVSSLRYQAAIPIAKNNRDSSNLIALSAIILLLIVFMTILLEIILFKFISNKLAIENLILLAIIFPICLLLSGGFSIFNYFAIRNKKYNIISKTRIFQSIIVVITQASFFKFGTAGLIIGKTFEQAAGFLYFPRLLKLLKIKSTISKNNMLDVACKYREFPLYSTWASFLNTANSELPTILLAFIFGPSSAGMYMLAKRILYIPISLISVAVGQVFITDAAEANKEGNLPGVLLTLYSKLVQIGLPPTLTLIIISPKLFLIVFGSEWQQAGIYAQWMAPWLFFVFLSSPLLAVFAIKDKLKYEMILNLFMLLNSLISIAIGKWIGGELFAIILLSLSGVFSNIFILIFLGKISGSIGSRMIFPFLNSIPVSIFCVSPLIIANVFDFDSSIYIVGFLTTCIMIMTRYWILYKSSSRKSDNYS